MTVNKHNDIQNDQFMPWDAELLSDWKKWHVLLEELRNKHWVDKVLSYRSHWYWPREILRILGLK